MNEKLRPKYTVQRVKGIDSPGGPVEPVGKSMLSTDPEDVNSPFVLMPLKDPAAFMAMLTYSTLCEHDLAEEIRGWLTKVAEAGPQYGTQGTRNHIEMRKTIIRLRLGL